jgi:hypothetical protein
MKKIALLAAIGVTVTVVENVAGETLLYFGGGIGGGLFKISSEKKADGRKESDNRTEVLGTIFVGSSKKLKGNACCIGGELMADFSKNDKYERSGMNTDGVVSGAKANRSGCVPSFAFKIGHCDDNYNVIYGKVGCAYSKITMEYHNISQAADCKLTVARLSPLIGAGYEHRVSGKYSARLEADYTLKTKRSDDLYKLERTGNFVVRALACYNASF